MNNKKPSSEIKRLLKIIGEIQTKIGAAEGLHANDVNPMGYTDAQQLLREAFDLCLDATAPYDPKYID